MNGNEPGIPDNLRIKFPHLQPVKNPPSLMTMNGIGLSIYGKRDVDAETQTYVKTHVLCVVFIPLLALGAYRVADAGPRRWYFIGKEPLSGLARGWNMAMGCALVLLALSMGWSAHTSSPEYQARQEIKHAATLAQAGQSIQAAGIYRRQLSGPAAAEARIGLHDTLETSLQSDQSQTVATAFRLLASLPANVNQPAPLVPEAFNRGLTLANKFRGTSPVAALDVLDAAAALERTNAAVRPLRIELLKEIVAGNSNDTNHLVELAVAYESDQQLEACYALLRPHQNQLGATEGARILGQKLLQEQNYADAYGLLFPYVQARLTKLHGVEAAYTNTIAAVQRQAIADLQAGRADETFYERHKAANKEQQDEMVDNFIETRLKNDASFQRVLQDLKAANQIVPVALDLGIVQLNRAQGLKDAGARKAELEAAEKTFLAIRSFAGETDEYRMFLGQVYYWLGKSKEGRELFDQLLASRKRSYGILISLSETLRSVGESADARVLVEEAYQTAKKNEDKYAAAALRALICKDEDDRMDWLQKADPASSWVQIELNEARGIKAMREGNKTLAATFLHQAVEGYSKQTKTAASLNNWALACFSLAEATGQLADQQHGIALLEEAVAMNPSDSILLHNTCYYLISQAMADVNHDAVHMGALGEQPGLHTLSCLYQNEAGRQKIYQQLHDNETLKKGLGYLDKALLLAPKNLDLYDKALTLHACFRDLNELQKLQQRLRIAAPDLTEVRQESLAAYSGSKDQKYLEKYQQQIKSHLALANMPAISQDPLTLDYVMGSLQGLQQNAWVYGGTADGRELLQAALATYQRHQSSASRSALQAAYFFRAGEELALQNPDFARLVKQTRRAVRPENLFCYLLEHGGPLAELAQKNENVTKAIALEKEDVANYPSWAAISQWAMLRNTDPATAAVVARRIQESETIRLADELQFQLNPWSANQVLEQYWTQRLLGNEKRAAEIYQQAVKDGVPLPWL